MIENGRENSILIFARQPRARRVTGGIAWFVPDLHSSSLPSFIFSFPGRFSFYSSPF
jgi:hypothetical protein